jgi:hypothetical protein
VGPPCSTLLNAPLVLDHVQFPAPPALKRRAAISIPNTNNGRGQWVVLLSPAKWCRETSGVTSAASASSRSSSARSASSPPPRRRRRRLINPASLTRAAGASYSRCRVVVALGFGAQHGQSCFPGPRSGVRGRGPGSGVGLALASRPQALRMPAAALVLYILFVGGRKAAGAKRASGARDPVSGAAKRRGRAAGERGNARGAALVILNAQKLANSYLRP